MAETPQDTYSDSSNQVWAGPKTKDIYSAQELKALRRQASVPLVVMSSDDLSALGQDEETAKAQILSQFPNWMQNSLTEKNVGTIYRSLVSGAPWALALDASGERVSGGSPFNTTNNSEQVAAAIIFVPGTEKFTEDYFRLETGIRFGEKTISSDALHECGLFIAGHEASHIRLFAERPTTHIENSEVGAEAGAFAFLHENADLFPVLSNNGLARNLVAGRRALSSLIGGGDNLGHDYGAYLNPDAETQPFGTQQGPLRQELNQIVPAVEIKIARRFYEKGNLDPSDADAFKAMESRVKTPRFFLTTEGSSFPPQNDFKADKTGLLERYLQKTRTLMTDNDQVSDALRTFFQTLSPLFEEREGQQGELQKAEDFMRQYGFSPHQIQAVMKQGKPFAATETLKKIRGALTREKKSWESDPDPKMPQAWKDGQVTSFRNVTSQESLKLLAPDHPFIRDLLSVVTELNQEGAFKTVWEKNYVANILAGAGFYAKPSVTSLEFTNNPTHSGRRTQSLNRLKSENGPKTAKHPPKASTHPPRRVQGSAPTPFATVTFHAPLPRVALAPVWLFRRITALPDAFT